MIAKTTCSIPFKYFVGVSNASYMNLMLNDSSNCKKKKVPLHPFSHGWRERQKHSQYLYPHKSSRKNSQKSYKKWWNGKQEMSKAFWSLCHLFHCSPLWCVNAQKDNALCNKLFNDPILYVMNVKNCETFERCKAIEQSQKSQQYKTLFYSLGSTVQILKRMQNYRRSQHAFASRQDCLTPSVSF